MERQRHSALADAAALGPRPGQGHHGAAAALGPSSRGGARGALQEKGAMEKGKKERTKRYAS